MLNVGQFRAEVVHPVLEHLGMWSQAAENLIVGTALQESALTYLKQLGGGPALGFFQMEPVTHDDIWKNYLDYREDLSQLVQGFTSSWPATLSDQLIGNLPYACVMARIKYARQPEALPAADDIEALGQYWKTYYNTAQGAGTVDEFVANYRKSAS